MYGGIVTRLSLGKLIRVQAKGLFLQGQVVAVVEVCGGNVRINKEERFKVTMLFASKLQLVLFQVDRQGQS